MGGGNGSLRTNEYDGHIIVGVNPAIPEEECNYTDCIGVTYYAIRVSNCSVSILDSVPNTGNSVCAKCSLGLKNLKLEWGQYQMSGRWLKACEL